MVEGIDGKPYYEFAGEFTHAGKKWCLNVFALDLEDAQLKFESVKESAVLLGGPVEVIPWDPLKKYRLK